MLTGRTRTRTRYRVGWCKRLVMQAMTERLGGGNIALTD